MTTSIIICTYKRASAIEQLMHSFIKQHTKIEQFLVIDASPDDDTKAVCENIDLNTLVADYRYIKAPEEHRGLTKQRNYGLSLSTGDIVMFFDDDIIYHDNCLKDIITFYETCDTDIVGVGGNIINTPNIASLKIWQLRKKLGLVKSLMPGIYHKTGISSPLEPLDENTTYMDVDWISGCCMTWRGDIVREEKFNSYFEGYSMGEDLEFSLRMKKRGNLVILRNAKISHFHILSGRPDSYTLGYTTIKNMHYIHKSYFNTNRFYYGSLFLFYWIVDTLIFTRNLLNPKHIKPTLQNIAGRVKGLFSVILS